MIKRLQLKKSILILLSEQNRKQSLGLVKQYEDKTIPPPLKFRDDYKPIPLPRTKRAPTEKPIPAPRTKKVSQGKPIAAARTKIAQKQKALIGYRLR